MIEVMIPDFCWEDEYWCYEKANALEDLKDQLKYKDGSVKNLIIEVDDLGNMKEQVTFLFTHFNWINKLIIKCGEKEIKVFGRAGS